MLGCGTGATGEDGGGGAGGEGGTDGAGGAETGGAGGGGGAPSIATTTFGPFQPWATPIEDYKLVGDDELPGKYDAAINELAPFGDVLWFGYGDGTYNMGEYTPIEFRFFGSPDDPTAAAALVDAAGQGAPQDTPTQSGEEQIDRYRILNGELWQAGVDSIDADELHTQATTDPPAIDGNAYRLVGDSWEKHRSIRGGEHVHDFAFWNGAVYGVGSGADYRFEFEAGEIFRYLWRTEDLGASFETVQRVMHPVPGTGDTRWVHLLSTSARLFLFGYESNFQTGNASVRNASYAGLDVEPLEEGDPLAKVFGLGTQPLPDGSGLAWGVDVSVNPLRYAIFHVGWDGAATKLDGFEGHRVVDAILHEDTFEIVYLTYPGDEYPGDDSPDPWEATAWAAPSWDPGAITPVASYTGDEAPRSIAYWKGGLHLGMADGQILRSAPPP